ncbi:MAG: PH domain-containing protein, partial [Actinomycetota bacterium]|nr:PH domain-containing protein [Actinomycetota bacterium]
MIPEIPEIPVLPEISERRLDWRVLVVHAVTFRQARAVLSGAGPLAAVAALQGRLGTFGLVGIAVVAAAASLVFAALRWWRFTFAVDGQRLLVRQGLISRTDRAIPLDRIRGVDVEASPLHRLFR